MGGFLDSFSTKLVHQAMNMRQIRQKLIASNISNVSTPQYVSQDIAFEKHLRNFSESPNGLMKTTHPNHIKHSQGVGSFSPDLIQPAQYAVNNDLNSVDLEHEMMKMAENNVMFDALVTVLGKRFEGIDYAIREGGK
jgi:flagellar basal-body rod protein FlgB